MDSERYGMTLPTSGLHEDVNEVLYHADRNSLSSSSAKNLIRKGAKAYQEGKQEGPVYRDAFDFGSVVHALVLGVGDYEVLFFDSYRSKKAKAARDEARAGGRAPILLKKYEEAVAMRDSVMRDTNAAALLNEGVAEVSVWATDPATGVVMRGRMDWLRPSGVFVDLKTTGRPADEAGFMGTVWDYGYGFQAAYYEKLMALNGRKSSPVWIAVEKNAPYNTGVFLPDEGLMARSRVDVDRALRLYAHCLETGEWPELEAGWEVPGVGAPALGSDWPYVGSVTAV